MPQPDLLGDKRVQYSTVPLLFLQTANSTNSPSRNYQKKEKEKNEIPRYKNVKKK